MPASPRYHHQELSFPQHMDFLQPTALALLPGVARWNYRQLASIRLQNRLHVFHVLVYDCQPGQHNAAAYTEKVDKEDDMKSLIQTSFKCPDLVPYEHI